MVIVEGLDVEPQFDLRADAGQVEVETALEANMVSCRMPGNMFATLGTSRSLWKKAPGLQSTWTTSDIYTVISYSRVKLIPVRYSTLGIRAPSDNGKSEQ